MVRTVQFAAYQPTEVQPNTWEPLLAYIYNSGAEGAVEQDARKQLDTRREQVRALHKPALTAVPEGAQVTATPVLPGFQFNPPSQTLLFYEDWQRFEFKLRATSAPLYQAANGEITFSVEGLIVGEIPLSVYVGAAQPAAELAHTAGRAFQAVFCSYSRRDLRIVERVESAYKALGLSFLRDMITLRSGEAWNEGLRGMIEQADIFQLFWSHHAAGSDHVRMEWEHALSLRRAGAFIRPVYWENPMPPAPPVLGHLHFAYAPNLGG